MTEAVIVAVARTAIGRARKGSLVDVDALELARAASAAPSAGQGSRPTRSMTSCWPSRCRAAG